MEDTASTHVMKMYEDTLAELLIFARASLNDPEFGHDVHTLAEMPSVPGVSKKLEGELLHTARAVARRRKRRA
jgi:hypothetical protein